MHGVGVGGGMHRNGGDAEFLARAQNTQCDLAAVGYEDFVKHWVLGKRANSKWRAANGFFPVTRSLFAIRIYSIITSGSPNSTGWPSSTRICVTVPARGDGIWVIVFMASVIRSGFPNDNLA